MTETSEKIWLASPHMSDEGYEMQYVQEAFDSNWIAPLGTNVNEFEKELASKVGADHAAALTSGTGDPPCTYGCRRWRRGHCIVSNAYVFCDSESDYLCECNSCLYRQRL